MAKKQISSADLKKLEKQISDSFRKIQELGKQALISLMKIEAASEGKISKVTMSKVHKVNRMLHGAR